MNIEPYQIVSAVICSLLLIAILTIAYIETYKERKRLQNILDLINGYKRKNHYYWYRKSSSFEMLKGRKKYEIYCQDSHTFHEGDGDKYLVSEHSALYLAIAWCKGRLSRIHEEIQSEIRWNLK